jgi:hypothetical protein
VAVQQALLLVVCSHALAARLCFLGIQNGSGHSTFVSGDVVSEFSRLKQEIGSEILV